MNKDIKFIGLSFILLILSAFATDKSRTATIYTIGDSTMADRTVEDGNLEWGWGQALSDFLTDDIRVENHAASGRSTLSFINEGRWDTVLVKLQKGDYVFIQFGHNDEKTAPDLHTVPGGSFDENLRRFIRETRAKGATPVLLNSIVRRNYPPPGQTENQYTYDTEGTTLVDTHGEYAEAPRRIAEEMNVPFVDMTRLTHDLVTGMGKEESKKLFMWVPKGFNDYYPNGKVDNTHLSIYGAKTVAQVAIEEVAKIIPEIALHVRHIDPEIYISDYKDDKVCAISYTFDDGLQEHYTQVYPKLEELGLKGTFWICGKIIEYEEAQLGKPRMTWVQMKEMSDRGHEISNHSWSHPNLTKLSEAEIRKEITQNDSIIKMHIGKNPVTFCYPGNAMNDQVVRLASEGRVGTRTNQYGIGGEISHSSVESLNKWISNLLASGQWGVSMTHGISYGYDAFPDSDVLWQHFNYVKKQEDKIWIAPFAEIAAYVKARNNIQLDIVKDKSYIEILPNLRLDAELFSGPLTMVVRKDGHNSKMKVSQNKQMLQLKEFEDRYLFDFSPFGGKIEIEF